MNVTTVLEEKIVLFMLWLKSWSGRGASHYPAFMGDCHTINHTILAYLPSGSVFL